MSRYRFTTRAKSDVLAIYAYSEAKYGGYQADAYFTGLERTFGLPADFPRIGAGCDELVFGFRRFGFQSHYIFYTEEPDHIVIRALIHVAMNLRPELFE